MRPPLTARVPGWLDPAHALELLADPGADVALLESSDGTGRSVLAFGDALHDALPEVPLDAAASAAPAFVGWLGYEGEARWLRVTRAVEFDHAARALTVHGDDAWVVRVRGAAASAAPLRPPVEASGRTARWRHDDEQYLALIARCQAAIVEGDAYQLCLTNTATVPDAPDDWQTYRRLRALSPTHSAGFVRLGDTTLVSASPERFVSVAADGVVRSSPIKGTRRRVDDPAADDALAAELRADEKEIAENLMIVDLVRNDLSRVAELGSVRVTRLLEVERYPQVHQLVSTVEASLRAGLTAADAVGALFPAGSMTGTPKLSAMGILRSLEAAPRGLYSGAFGIVRRDGSADLAMVIRSVVFAGGTATVGAGGGITALSRPAAELAEVELKAAPLLAALGARADPPAAPPVE